MEVWKDVVGFEGLYQVSSWGRVKSLARPRRSRIGFRTVRERILKTVLNRGYPCVNLHRLMDQNLRRVHRLVAEAFIPNPRNKPEVNHKDGIRINSRLSNLEWATSKENGEHAAKNGLVASGYRQGHAKLSPQDVAFIRREAGRDKSYGCYARINRKLLRLRKVKVDVSTVRSVAKGLTYKNK